MRNEMLRRALKKRALKTLAKKRQRKLRGYKKKKSTIQLPIPEIDENKIVIDDEGEVTITEPDNAQVDYNQIIPYYKEEVVQLPPEDVHIIDSRTRNIVLKRKHPPEEAVNVKKFVAGTDITTRNVWDVALPQPAPEGSSSPPRGGEDQDIKPFIYQRGLATVDIYTMRRIPWVDFSVILSENDPERREETIMTLLQNNIPADNDTYYIYHDQETNTFSVEVDEDAEEIRDLIEGVYVIDARLKYEAFSSKERKVLKDKRKRIIEILQRHYGDKTLSRVLSEKMTPEKQREIEEQIFNLQQNLNQDSDDWFYNYNEQTEE